MSNKAKLMRSGLGLVAGIGLLSCMLAYGEEPELRQPPDLSGDDTKLVMEFFTSQNCPACPKANKVFGHYTDHKNIIALSYSVGYWDYLGWEDSFAKASFDERQSDYADKMALRAPFTPQVIFQGEEYCSGRNSRIMGGKVRRAMILSDYECAVSLEPLKNGNVKAEIKGDFQPVDLETSLILDVVTYNPGEEIMKPGGGQNQNRQMSIHNRVIDVQSYNYLPETISCEPACAVMIRSRDKGDIWGAAKHEWVD